jgi:hypothetical protein
VTRKEEWIRMMCLPLYPQDSGVNEEGEWKVVCAVKYIMIISQILTDIILHAEDGRHGAVRTRQGRVKSDSMYYHHRQVKMKLSSLIIVCLEYEYVRLKM